MDDKKKGSKVSTKELTWDEMMQIRVNKDLKSKLKQAAREAGDTSSSSYVRRVLLDHFREKSRKGD